jgi:hypothetical protein
MGLEPFSGGMENLSKSDKTPTFLPQFAIASIFIRKSVVFKLTNKKGSCILLGE